MNRDRNVQSMTMLLMNAPNSVMDGSDGYESDRAALQLITSYTENHQNFK